MTIIRSADAGRKRMLTRTRTPIRIVVAACCLFLTACAAQNTAPRGGQRNLLTAADLARAGDVSLFEAIRMLRPTFLEVRPASMAGTKQAAPPQVFVGSLEMMEGVEHLREIMAKDVQEVRLLEPREANARFGGNHGTGALLITMQP
jgi:hypothetical protein